MLGVLHQTLGKRSHAYQISSISAVLASCVTAFKHTLIEDSMFVGMIAVSPVIAILIVEIFFARFKSSGKNKIFRLAYFSCITMCLAYGLFY
jgi:hypothetical protein